MSVALVTSTHSAFAALVSSSLACPHYLINYTIRLSERQVATHQNLVPSWSVSGAVTPLSHTPSCRAKGQICIYFQSHKTIFRDFFAFSMFTTVSTLLYRNGETIRQHLRMTTGRRAISHANHLDCDDRSRTGSAPQRPIHTHSMPFPCHVVPLRD